MEVIKDWEEEQKEKEYVELTEKQILNRVTVCAVVEV